VLRLLWSLAQHFARHTVRTSLRRGIGFPRGSGISRYDVAAPSGTSRYDVVDVRNHGANPRGCPEEVFSGQ